MEKWNIRRNTETPIDQDAFPHTSGSSRKVPIICKEEPK